MARIKFKAEIHGQLDTDDYAVPADGNLSLQLKEDIQEAIEGSVSIEVNNIKVTRTGGKLHDEQDQDRD